MGPPLKLDTYSFHVLSEKVHEGCLPVGQDLHLTRFASAHPDGGPLRFPQFVATGNPLQISAALEHAQ